MFVDDCVKKTRSIIGVRILQKVLGKSMTEEFFLYTQDKKNTFKNLSV